MKIKKADSSVLEGDMTPMIDMTFQLIAFLMVLVNFAAEDVSARVVLPESELARPPEGKPNDNKILVQLDKEGMIIYGAEVVSIEGLKTMLKNEAYLLQSKSESPADALVVVRAHKDCPTGKVQEVIKTCQEQKFDRFVLRAKEKE
jgi:biopolymer transport protein ExbD